jgi:hypothetical protein
MSRRRAVGLVLVLSAHLVSTAASAQTPPAQSQEPGASTPAKSPTKKPAATAPTKPELPAPGKALAAPPSPSSETMATSAQPHSDGESPLDDARATPTTASSTTLTTSESTSAAPTAGATTTGTTTTGASTTDARARRLIAVLDLKAGPAARAQANALTTMLTAEVSAQDGLRAVSRAELQALLVHQSTAQLVGCDDPRCLADVAQLANADEIVSGSVERVDGATIVNLTRIFAGGDGEEPHIVSRQQAVWHGSDDELLLVTRPLVQRLFDAAGAHSHVGALELLVPAGTAVLLDDQDVGSAPTAVVRALPTGVHRLRLRKDGFVEKHVDVIVGRNETTIVRVELEEIPLWSQPWFLATAGGVGLVAIGSTAGIVVYAITNATPPPARVVLGTKD